MASGNLTTVKGGKPFFAGLGWEIVERKAAARPLQRTTLPGRWPISPRRSTRRLRRSRLVAPGLIEPTSFALLRRPRPVIPRAGPSAGCVRDNPSAVKYTADRPKIA